MIEKNKEMDKVVFRRWKGNPKSVIALFPYQDEGNYLCNSYEHHGQHGCAYYDNIINLTIPAKMEEEDVKDLYKELEERGYNLNIIKRKQSIKRNKYN